MGGKLDYSELETRTRRDQKFFKALFISLGISTLFFAGSKAVMGINVFDFDNLTWQLIFEWVIIFIASFACTAPLYYISSKLYWERIKFNDIKKNLTNIENNLTKPLIKDINEIDNYTFKEKRHPFYIKQLKKISKEKDDYFYNVLYVIVSSWKSKIKERTELSRILVQRQLEDLKISININTFYFSLNSYLNFILDLIELCFQFEGKFIYHSFTNAAPSEWFDSNNKDLKEYRKKFSKLLKSGGSGNILRRTVLCYNSQSENDKIKSKSDIEDDWDKLPAKSKNIYINEFVATDLENSNLDYLILNDNLKFEQGFTEIIYLGYYSEDDGQEKWKWCLVTEYNQKSSVVRFQFHNLISAGKILLIKGNSESSFKDIESEKFQENIELNLLEFMEIVVNDNKNYVVDSTPIIQTKKFECSDVDTEDDS